MKHIEELNKLVANLTVFYTKLHSFHWLVTGNGFYTLHEVFEGYYDKAAEDLDEVAERLLIIGGKPVSTLKGALELSEIKEASEKETASEMVEILLADFQTLMENLKRIMEAADEVEDHGTVSLAEGIKTEYEKNIWMLKAYQG